MSHLFELSCPTVAIAGDERRFPVRRIFCVGRNYAAHAREMGMDPDREPPFFFMKPADAVVENGADVPYPPGTRNLHHEIELVVAIGGLARDLTVDEASAVIFGYAVGNDLTRRDLQFAMREKGRPWEVGKAFDHAAPLTAIHPAARIGHPRTGRIWLTVNGERRQEADIADLIWSVPEILMHLARLFTLKPGALVFTGTPAGVGPLVPGDVVEGGVEGVDVLRHRIVAPERSG